MEVQYETESFDSGEYGLVNSSLMPKTAQARRIQLLLNCFPLSTLRGIPLSFDYDELLTMPKKPCKPPSDSTMI